MPSLTIEQGYPDVNVFQQFAGVRISKLGFIFGGDAELTASVDVMGCENISGHYILMPLQQKQLISYHSKNLNATIKRVSVAHPKL